MRRRSDALCPLLAAGLLIVLAACGTDATRTVPVSKFSQYADSTRVFESIDGVDGIEQLLSIPPGSRKIALHFDCRSSKGTVKLSTKTVDELAAGLCSEKSGEGRGVVANEVDDEPVSVIVSVPAGGRWSVAVDAAP